MRNIEEEVNANIALKLFDNSIKRLAVDTNAALIALVGYLSE